MQTNGANVQLCSRAVVAVVKRCSCVWGLVCSALLCSALLCSALLCTREIGDCRLETGDWRLETGDWRLETGLDCPVSLTYDQHEQAREHEGREAREARGQEKKEG